MAGDDAGSSLARWRGLFGLATQLLRGRAVAGPTNRITLSIGIVTLAVALLIIVTGISAGLATQSTVYGDAIDYWIVPKSATTLTTVVTVRGPQLGDVHETSTDIERIDGVSHVTPVLVDIVRLRAPDSEHPEYILAVGVIPAKSGTDISGIETTALSPGDPHFADGRYDGPLTGEVILSPAAAELMNASRGDDLVVASPASGEIQYSPFAVTRISEANLQTVGGDLPVAVFHLSELQTLTGAAEGDQADQLLVETTDPGVKPALQQVYPDASVIARQSLNPQQVIDSDLPLAISLTALVAGLVIAGLFVTTTMGLEIEADRQLLAVFAAVGISQRGRLIVVATTTLGIALVGGICGVVLGLAGIVLVNAIATTQYALPPIARLHPLLIVYGLGVALSMGLLAVPYPLFVAARSSISEELMR